LLQPEQRTDRITGLDGKTYPRQIDPQLPERVRALRDAGWTVREIAREVAASVGTVHRYTRGD
jgi:DNA invertase Pin-like site-specific DNA recombinase